jgi:hypothetical protein
VAAGDGLEGVDAALERARAQAERQASVKVEVESIAPSERNAVLAVWRHIRRRLPALALLVLVGGSSGFGGRKVQDAAVAAALEASAEEQARLRREARAAEKERDELSAELRKVQRDLATETDARVALAVEFRKLQVQVNTFESAKTAVIRAEPDRAPQP